MPAATHKTDADARAEVIDAITRHAHALSTTDYGVAGSANAAQMAAATDALKALTPLLATMGKAP